MVQTLIQARPGDVAAVLADADLAPKWQAGLERMEVVEGTAGSVGARARLHYVENGKRSVLDDELLEHEPVRRWRSKVSGGGLTAEVETILVEQGAQTRVEMAWSGRPDALLARPFFLLFKPALARRAQADLDALKVLVESRAS